MIKSFRLSSDTIGILASLLCVIHCMATPLLLLSQAALMYENGLKTWWGNLDYVLCAISFIAIYFSTASSPMYSKSKIVHSLLWVFLAALTFLIVNEKMKWKELPDFLTYLASGGIVILHFVNLKLISQSFKSQK